MNETEDIADWQFFHDEGVKLFRNCKKYRAAIEAFSNAIKCAEEAQLADSYIARALVYYELADYDNVIADCTVAINLLNNLDAHKISHLHITRGMAYKYKKQFDEASADFQISASLHRI